MVMNESLTKIIKNSPSPEHVDIYGLSNINPVVICRSWSDICGISPSDRQDAGRPTLGRFLLLHADLPGLKQPSK